MAALQVTQAQRDKVRVALGKIVEADEVVEFDDEDLNVPWQNKFRTVAAFQKATRQTLLSVLSPGLVGYLKPDAAGNHCGICRQELILAKCYPASCPSCAACLHVW